VTPDDIKAVAPGVLSHRLISHDRTAEVRQAIITAILQAVPVPVG
jgi:MoxR-like ATPase